MKKLLFLFLTVFTLKLSAQKIVKIEQVNDYSNHVVGNNFEGVIFSKKYSSDSSADSTKRFTPTVEQILQTENILQHQMGKLYCKYPKSGEFYVSKHMEDYYRQYTGFINNKGDSIIIINGFTKDLNVDETTSHRKKPKIPEWFTKIIVVFDGGRSIWTGNIDLNTKKLIGISVNGVA